jgi:hypothetical protein
MMPSAVVVVVVAVSPVVSLVMLFVTPNFVSIMMGTSPAMSIVLRAMTDEAVPTAVEMPMMFARPLSPTIGFVITVTIASIDIVCDQIALVIKRCR